MRMFEFFKKNKKGDANQETDHSILTTQTESVKEVRQPKTLADIENANQEIASLKKERIKKKEEYSLI